MGCPDCSRFDPEARRCRDGKINPLRYGDAVEVANVFGARAICPFSDFRERLMIGRVQIDRPRPKRRK